MPDTRRELAALLGIYPDNATGDISPQDGRDFMVSVYPDVANVMNYGAVGDDVADDTAAIQAAIDDINVTDGGRGGIVYLPALKFKVTQLELKDGVALIGEQVGVGLSRGTVLNKAASSNISIIVNDSTFGVTDFQHYVLIENIEFRNDPGNTAGHGIEWNTRCGESWTVRRCSFIAMAENGIHLTRGGTAVIIDDVHCFACGQDSGAGYGVNVQRTGGDRCHGFWLNRISGDNNEDGLIRISSPQAAHETINITDVKAETTTAGKQQTVILLATCSAITTIRNVSNNALVSTSSMIKITGANPALVLENIRSESNTTNLIDDVFNSTTVPLDAGFGDGPGYLFYRGSEKFRVDKNGLKIGGRSNAAMTFRHSASATLDFPSIAANTTDTLTITVTGALVATDVAYASPINSALEAGLVSSARVSANDTVEVTLANVTTSAINPASRTWRAVAERFA